MTSRQPQVHDANPDWERTARVLQPMVATLFFLSSLRVLTSQFSLRISDGSDWEPLGVLALLILAAPLLAIALRRHCTHPAMISAVPFAMALARVVGQAFNRPDVNWICAGAVIALYGFFLPLYAGWLAARESRGIYALTWGIVAAFPLDLVIRALFASADPFLHQGFTALLLIVALAAILASRTLTWPRRSVREPIQSVEGGGWSDGLMLTGLGTTLFLAYALYLNVSMAGPLANATYPAAVATCVGIAALAATALYYDADGVHLVDQIPLTSAVLANVALSAATGVLLVYRPSHLNLPVMAVGLGCLLINVVLLGRLLASTRGHPTLVLGVGLWLGLLLMMALIMPMLLLGSEGSLLAGAGLTAVATIAAGAALRRRDCPTRAFRAVPWVWAGAVALFVLAALALLVQPGGTIPEPRQEVTLMTYNIRSGFGADDAFDLTRVAGAITAANADIVALQEVNRGTGLNGFTDDIVGLMDLLRPAGYRYWSFGAASTPWLGNAVLSRYPIVASQNYPYDTVLKERGACLAARVKIGGRRIAVYSTHLAPVGESTSARLSQVDQLLALVSVEGLPRAMMGDLNATPLAEEIIRLDDQYDDAYVKAGGSLPGHTFPSDMPASRIDYVFVSSDLLPLEARVPEGLLASDHLPVIVQLRLP